MKRTIALLLVVFYLLASADVAGKSTCNPGSRAPFVATHANDTCKMGVVMGKCCMAKKHHNRSKSRHYGSVAAAFLAKMFPVLSDYVSTDTVVNEPCLYRLHA